MPIQKFVTAAIVVSERCFISILHPIRHFMLIYSRCRKHVHLLIRAGRRESYIFLNHKPRDQVAWLDFVVQ